MAGAFRYTTINCVRHWRWYPKVGPAEIVRNVAPVCVRAAALAIPLALPGAASVPPAVDIRAGGLARAVLSGPAYEVGALFAPGVYEIPLRWFQTPAAVPAGWIPAEAVSSAANSASSTTAVGESPTLTPMLSGAVPHWWPDRHVPGQSVLATEVPEPSTWMVLAAAVVAALACKHLSAKASA